MRRTPHYLRAKIYTEQNEIEKAAAELKKAVALRPDFAEAWSDLGQARKTLLDDDGAFAAFQRSVELDRGRRHLAVPARRRVSAPGRCRRGRARILRESYRLNPKNQSTLHSLQLALRQDGKVEEAARIKEELAALLRQIDQESQAAFGALQLNNEGAALEKSGNLRGALEKYRQAVALDPEHAGFHMNFGVALLRLGQWKEGLSGIARRRPPRSRTVP